MGASEAGRGRGFLRRRKRAITAVAGVAAIAGFVHFVVPQLTPDTTSASHVLPGLTLIGVGMGCIFGPSFAIAIIGINPNGGRCCLRDG